jgi:hypothetical protein
LLVRLVAKNIELFKAALKEASGPEEVVPAQYAWLLKLAERLVGQVPKEPELTWNEIDGSFTVGSAAWSKWVSSEHTVGLGTASAMQEIWSACFDQTVVDHYDTIETDLWHEKKHGLD